MPILTLPAKLLVMGKVSLEDGERESAVWGRSFNREERHPPSLIRKRTPLFDVKLVKY